MKNLFTTAIILPLSMMILAGCATAQTSGGTVSGNAPTTAGGSGNQAALTWTLVANSPFGKNVSGGVAYGNGRFVVVGSIWDWENARGLVPNSNRIAYSNVQE